MERHEAGAAWREHMVITRTGYGARAVESFLVEKKVPYRFVGGVGLLQAAHVKDLFGPGAGGSQPSRRTFLGALPDPVAPDRGCDRRAPDPPMKTCTDPLSALDILEKSLKGRREIIDGVRKIIDCLETSADRPQTGRRIPGADDENPLQ